MTDTSAAGAKAALDGYEYQLDVSVFAALRLMLITKAATRITLEPASEEDLEADLAPDTLGRVTPSAEVADGYRLVIQVKLRRTGPWSIAAIDALLKRGKRRRPARHHLDDPDTRYLLVTNAGATGEALGLLVEKLEDWPDPSSFPKGLAKTLPHAPGGRLAVWGSLSRRQLDLEIREILGVLLRVPDRRLIACRDQLRQDAQQRMRGTNPGVWTAEDLLATIRSRGGYLASAPELERFVPPANYQAMVDALEERNAVIITGPSGTGKTWAALALCALARQRQSRLEIINVNVNNDPSSTRKPLDSGPTLSYIEDPWGQYSVRGGAEAWTEQLPRLLREASPGHQYVITSRTDMLVSAKADAELKRWSVALDADQYRHGKLASIYDEHLDLLATDLQSRAWEFRADALKALETPLEIDLFFTYLADGPAADEAGPAFYRRVLDQAHRDAVGNVVSRYLAASAQTGAAAIVWALLAARGQFDRSQLTRLQRQIRAVDRPLAEALEKLLNRLVATRHLRQPVQTVSFAHPSVRAGFEAFLEANWSASEAALEVFVSALTKITGAQTPWARETAARSIAAIDDLAAGSSEMAAIMFEADPASRAAIDGWLEEGLLDPKSDFGAVLKLASDVGSARSIPSELARWFIKSVRRGGQVFMSNWKAPEFDDAWYQRVSSDPRSAAIAGRFVREQLPGDRDGFGDTFPARLDRIATGLTPAYLAAAMRLIGAGFGRNVGAVAAGAIRDLGGYEAVLAAALDDLAQLRRDNQALSDTWRAIEDGECDAAYAENYPFGHEDDGFASNELVDAYVREMLRLGRWQTLADHPRAAELGRHWAQTIARSRRKVSADEFRAVIAATKSSGHEDDAWTAVRLSWNKALASDLAERIATDPQDQSLRDALVRCAFAVLPEALSDRIERLAESPAALARLLVDLAAAHALAASRTRRGRLNRVLATAPDEVVEVFRALPHQAKRPRAVAPAARALLERAAATAEPVVLNAIVPILIESGDAPVEAVGRWLSATEDSRLARAAAEAAVLLGDAGLAWRALSHPRADARGVAMRFLASVLADPLPRRLLTLAADRGSRVRRGLVAILSHRPHPDHRQVLVSLLGDQWSDAEPHYDEPESYPIAREATRALGAYEAVADDIGDVLVARAEETDDRQLGAEALEIAALRCGPEVRRKIWAAATMRKPRWISVDAVDALSTAATVEPEILDAITSDRLLRVWEPLAASATVLLATHGPIPVVVRTLERLAHSIDRRALLLLGASRLAERDRAAARRLLALLDPAHPAQRLLNLEDGERLSPTVLDDLGNIRMRRAVRVWLADVIAAD